MLQQSLKILIVDDDNFGNAILADYLKSANYQVEVITESKKAWEILQDHGNNYAAVIVDRVMLGIDGIELLHRMKQKPALKNLPVIMQTGEALPEEFVAAMAAGVFDFVYKPVDKSTLIMTIKNAIARR